MRKAAVSRLVAHYAGVSLAADAVLEPYRRRPAVCGTAPPPSGPQYDAAMLWFTDEHTNLIEYTDQALADDLPILAYQLAWALSSYLSRQSFWADWVRSQTSALTAAEILHDPAASLAAHWSLGQAYPWLGRLSDGIAHHRQALQLAETVGDTITEGYVHRTLSWVFELVEEYPSALLHARRALDLLTAADDENGIARALNAVGWTQGLLGEHRVGLGSCEQALALFRRLGNRLGEANTLDSIGYLHAGLGRPEQAIRTYQDALDLHSQIGNRFAAAHTLQHLAEALEAARDVPAAHAAWEKAAALLELLGHPRAGYAAARAQTLTSTTDSSALDPPLP